MRCTSFEFRSHAVNLVRFATHVRAYVAYRCDDCLQHHQRFSGCVTVRVLVRPECSVSLIRVHTLFFPSVLLSRFHPTQTSVLSTPSLPCTHLSPRKVRTQAARLLAALARPTCCSAPSAAPSRRAAAPRAPSTPRSAARPRSCACCTRTRSRATRPSMSETVRSASLLLKKHHTPPQCGVPVSSEEAPHAPLSVACPCPATQTCLRSRPTRRPTTSPTARRPRRQAASTSRRASCWAACPVSWGSRSGRRTTATSWW